MLPAKVKRDIDEIKTPSNRILVTILLIAITTLSGIYYRNNEQRRIECERSCEKKDSIIDSLKNATLRKSETDNTRLITRVAWQDSIKQVLQSIIDKNLSNKK